MKLNNFQNIMIKIENENNNLLFFVSLFQ